MKKITKLRKWQIEAFQVGRIAQYFLFQCPGGAGKSLMQVMLAQADPLDLRDWLAALHLFLTGKVCDACPRPIPCVRV